MSTESDSPVFDWVSDELERRTNLKRIEARGTLRLVLKDAGLDIRGVTKHQMDVAVRRLLPDALMKRRVQGDVRGICDDIADSLAKVELKEEITVETAYDIFRRLGGDA